MKKDTLLARELGLNAITLTGGASAEPNDLVLSSFKDREIVVCYDNDEAGRNGANKIYKALHNIAKSVKYINIAEIVEKEKEDFYDAVKTYGMDLFTFELLYEHEFDKKLLSEHKKYTSIQKCFSK